MSFLWMFSRFYLSISEGYLCVLGAVLFLFILFGVPWILRFLVYAFPQILDSFIHYFLNFFPTPPPHLPLPYDSLDSLQWEHSCIQSSCLLPSPFLQRHISSSSTLTWDVDAKDPPVGKGKIKVLSAYGKAYFWMECPRGKRLQLLIFTARVSRHG